MKKFFKNILEDYITDLNKEPIEDNETKRVFLNNTLTFVIVIFLKYNFLSFELFFFCIHI